MRLLLVFWWPAAGCACVCLLWGWRGSHGQGGKFEANRVEMQVMKQGEKEGDYTQPGYLHRCKFLRLVKNTVNFLFCWF